MVNFFSNYIQPVIHWLHTNPYGALFLTFLISFAESLAIIGSIIPGSLTMTAIGILAGSGTMRIDLTFMAAILGAIGGDGLSYLLGYYYSEQLPRVWPFSRYPYWLTYGKEYFVRHGGKSVLLGRFIGPLRSIIPLIAGMLHMNRWRFLVANILSAIGWSFLYLMPGIIIGTASSDLSPPSATRLFFFVLIFLTLLWLATLCLKWIFIKMNYFIPIYFHRSWRYLKHHQLTRPIITFITPYGETNHFFTMAYSMGVVISALFFYSILLLPVKEFFYFHVDTPIYLFLQSIHTTSLDFLFITIKNFLSPLTLSIVFIYVFCLTLYYAKFQDTVFWILIHVTAIGLLWLSQIYYAQSLQFNFLSFSFNRSYPDFYLTIAYAQFLTLILYIHKEKNSLIRFNTYSLLGILSAATFSTLYVGSSSFSNVLCSFFMGCFVSLSYALIYRKNSGFHSAEQEGKKIAQQTEDYYQKPLKYIDNSLIPLIITSSLLCSMLSPSTYIQDNNFIKEGIYESDWWHQKNTYLPLFRTNRIGKQISLFNIQYAGSLGLLESTLTAYGFYKKNDTFLTSLLKRLSGEHIIQDNPLLSPLYLNKKPALIMEYQDKKKVTYILRVWQSSVYLLPTRRTLWIGTFNIYTKPDNPNRTPKNSLVIIKKALNDFPQKLIKLRGYDKDKLSYPYAPFILIVKGLS